jgi:hypothetical protein
MCFTEVNGLRIVPLMAAHPVFLLLDGGAEGPAHYGDAFDYCAAYNHFGAAGRHSAVRQDEDFSVSSSI